MIYDILEAKLAAAGFVPGVSLFRSYMPPEAIIGVMTRAPLSGIEIDPFIKGWYKVDFQVITRHKDSVLGDIQAALVQKTLFVESPEFYPASAERGKAQIAIFQPKTLPIFFPSLVGNGYEWSQHFNATFGFEAL